MNKSIYKYELMITNTQKVELPVGAEILTVQLQFESPCLWALVEPDQTETETRVIEIFGTGHTITDDIGVSRKYINTFQTEGGVYIFHVFEFTGN